MQPLNILFIYPFLKLTENYCFSALVCANNTAAVPIPTLVYFHFQPCRGNHQNKTDSYL